VTKLWVIPGALGAVLFPAFAAHLSGDQWRIMRLYLVGVKSLLVTMLPLCLLIMTFAEDGLEPWLGTEFAIHSTAVLQWLTVGVLINSIAQIPVALIQSVGRADVTARLHLLELPFYLVILWGMLRHLALPALAAWALRATLDMLILLRLVGDVVAEALLQFVRFALACIGRRFSEGRQDLPGSQSDYYWGGHP
jgi:O-antigen/teichoic acid export membrane protein